MSGLHIDSLGELPPGVRRQVAVKIVARRVADEVSAEEQRKRKKAKRLLALKDAQLEGAIYDLKVDHTIVLREKHTTPQGKRRCALSHVADFTYKVNLPLDHWPNCCDMEDLKYWHVCADLHGNGCMIAETMFDPERFHGEFDDSLLREKGWIYREV